MRRRAWLVPMMVLVLGACDPGDDEDSLDDGADVGSDDGAGDGLGGGDDDGAGGGGPSGEPTFRGDVAPILSASCGCHGGGAGGLAFDGDTYGALVGVPAVGADMVYVEPGDVEASYLVHKIRGTQASVGGSGSVMPPAGPLSDSQIETIEVWIEAGAPE